MFKNTMDCEELRKLSRFELIDQINNHEVSLLRSIGAGELLDEMELSGIFTRMLVKYVTRRDSIVENRKEGRSFVKGFIPAKLMSPFPEYEHCVVIGFNHPSLGEVFRLFYLSFSKYITRKYLFPVNIPWYETITPVIPLLERIGVYVSPMITPKTESKLLAKFADNPDMIDQIGHYKFAFERVYMKVATDMSKEDAVIMVAPSATRQAEVFEDEAARRGEGHIHPTMSMLAHRICSKPDSQVMFIPVTVVEPKHNDKKFNFFKVYDIYPCEPFTGEEAHFLSSEHKRDLDYQFLKRIDDIYQEKRHKN